MSKTLTLSKQQTATMSFLQDAKKFAVPAVRSSEGLKDPLQQARTRFGATANDQIALIKKGDVKGRWFFKDPTGRYIVTFRNGHVIMNLDGETHFAQADDKAAISFIEAAKKAVLEKELDEVLKASTRVLKPRKPKAEKQG